MPVFPDKGNRENTANEAKPNKSPLEETNPYNETAAGGNAFSKNRAYRNETAADEKSDKENRESAANEG